MKYLLGFAALVSCLAASAAAHVYPPNVDPDHTAFFGQLGRDSVVVTNAPVARGSARMLPKYLHALDFDDSYPEAAEEYYRSRGDGKVDGGCSAVRSGNFIYRNFDYPFDDRAEFVVKMSTGVGRFASVGMAQVGTNLIEQMVTSGKWSKWYKALPGATIDGINENGVVAEINVVDTPVTGWHTTGDLHPLAAVRWVLDNATNAYQAATYLAANISFPQGWSQNFHYMIADATSTYIVENGTATDGDEYHEPDEPVTMTNFQLSKFPWDGMGMERFGLLLGGANITNAWYTRAYHRETTPPWVSDLREVLAFTNDIFNAWATHDKEYFRNQLNGGQPWWQTVHTSVYDLTNRTLRIAVQETDDWYTFQVPAAGGVKAETDPTVPAWAKQANPPIAPVQSVNGKTGAVQLGAADVGAYAKSNSFQINGGNGISVGSNLTDEHSSRAEIDGGSLTFFDGYGGSTRFDPYGYIYSTSGGMWQFPIGISGTVMVESWQSLSRAFDTTATNATARASVGAKMMTLIDQPVTTKINQSVSARLNTYIDGATGVEYEGKWYGGSMYFVPTGNVYPPNN